MHYVWIFIFFMMGIGIFFFGAMGVPAQPIEIKRHLALS